MQIDALAFGPHPDDVELTCAGTLIRLKDLGYSTAVVTITRGELGTRGTPESRALEFQNAARVMELDYWKMLGIPDGGVSDRFQNKLEVIREIRECRVCTSMMANHRAYGRPPQPYDSTLCECCEETAPQADPQDMTSEEMWESMSSVNQPTITTSWN